ncbi:helix-turn-helix domain-containing protein [Streptomyces sp. NPDC048409]|uniref:TetR/AcrR family transcriptional regulator n=1 Tax=unclassified Streptomyces TaxID=2593676 RepID=UPI003448AEDC
MMSEGLRERSKARRREAILRAAYRLFADRGFEATTIADIAEAAEVSPRTVTLYFPSKLELATSRFDAFTDRLGTAVRDRAEGHSIVDSLEGWLRAEAADHSELDDLYDRMLELNPQVKAVANTRLTEVIQEGTRILAEERGETPDDFGPRMAAAAAAAVVCEVMCRTPREHDIETAMAFLRAGIAALPAPRPATDPGRPAPSGGPRD